MYIPTNYIGAPPDAYYDEDVDQSEMQPFGPDLDDEDEDDNARSVWELGAYLLNL